MKNGILSRFVERWRRHWLLLLGDILVVVVAVYAAMLMRFAPILPIGIVEETTGYLPYISLSYVGVFLLFGMYRVLWRNADSKQIIFLAFANIVGCGVTFLWNNLFECELSLYFLLILFALTLAGTCGIRMALRVVSDAYSSHRQKDEFQMDSHRLLVVGAGKMGRVVIDHCRTVKSNWGDPVAIVDDDKHKHGSSIGGVPVRGSISDIPHLVRTLGISDILIALPSVHGERLQEIVSICRRTHCFVRLLPDGQPLDPHAALTVREPDLRDFLSRPLLRVNDGRIRAFIEGHTVLVTGGAGSVGGELIRQMLPFRPQKIVVFDASENYAFELRSELERESLADCPIVFEIGSVRDAARIDRICAAHRPSVVFHAAAHKQIALMEDAPTEAIKNNISGLLNTIQAARRHGCQTFVHLSSEIGVNPVNALGATVHVAEDAARLAAEEDGMALFTVRFGSVLACHGGLLPQLMAQIHNGGPVRLGAPEAEKYFVTLPEIAQLILEAASLGESRHTYVLDMGSPMKVCDLAARLIRFHGFEPDTDIPIQIVGIHPGEKFYGEMYTEAEAILLSSTGSDRVLGMLTAAPDAASFREALDALQTEENTDRLQALFKTLVPSYRTVIESITP